MNYAWLLGLWWMGVVWAMPIDTLKFGFLEIGMTEYDVAQRVGPPDIIQDGGFQSYIYHKNRKTYNIPSGHLGVIFFAQRTIWIYAGGGNLLTTYLIFEDGKLVKKDKRRE